MWGVYTAAAWRGLRLPNVAPALIDDCVIRSGIRVCVTASRAPAVAANVYPPRGRLAGLVLPWNRGKVEYGPPVRFLISELVTAQSARRPCLVHGVVSLCVVRVKGADRATDLLYSVCHILAPSTSIIPA